MNGDALHKIRGTERTPDPFHLTLLKHSLHLAREKTTILQVNMGLLCNQACRHCHLNAGPDRTENMNSETADAVMTYTGRSSFDAVDITGGAPELNPNTFGLIEGLFPLTQKIIFRSNLTALTDGKRDDLMVLLKEKKVHIVASLPSLNEAQADAQRGDGVFRKSIAALRKLNNMGYGQVETGLVLDLGCNPAGAFLPAPEEQLSKRFHEVLMEKWGIVFNNLFAFANVPLGRFRSRLEETGTLESYRGRLASSFNACAAEGLMCRTQVSISWDGYLYDCDFNMAKGLHMGKEKMHVSEMAGPPPSGSPIAVADHCYTCMAGAGFT